MDNKKNKTSRRFIETCPKGMTFFPKKICRWGKAKVLELQGEKIDCPTCQWYIKDITSKYCFWVHLDKNKNCREHTLEEIATLTNTSINNIKLAETSGIKRIIKSLRNYALRTLFKK